MEEACRWHRAWGKRQIKYTKGLYNFVHFLQHGQSIVDKIVGVMHGILALQRSGLYFSSYLGFSTVQF